MSTNENKDIVRRQWYQELWDNWNISVADDLFTPDYVLHLPGSPPINRDGAKQVVAMFSTAFPDLKHTVDEMVSEGNTVAARWTVRGTHQGTFQGIVPAGKQIVLSGTTVHHMVNGRIVETWLSMDNLDLLQQLGAIPKPS
jgi:steroid delta-isomerase-like uncharacterized protein